MKIHQIFFKNNLRNFCYLISFNDGAIYCIDPTRSTEVVNYLKEKNLTAIINTHDHCDHFSGNVELVSIYHCPVMAHPNAIVPHKNKNLLDQEIIYQGINQQQDTEDFWVLKTVYTPGHTAGHLCVLLEKNHRAYALFTGDCFFNAGVGNCHNGGSVEVLYQTISTVFKNLSDDVLIYPGHEYLKRNLEFTHKYEPHNIKAKKFLQKISTQNLDECFVVNNMKTEREINTFLRLDSIDLKLSLNLENSNEKKIFLTLRELRNNW